jgi:AbrB family looped-hinge helix DNA binding protein
MSVTVSSKYQVVIPKAVRRQLDIRPGQRISISTNRRGQAVIVKDSQTETGTSADKSEDIMRFAGILRDDWGKDPVKRLREIRDNEWD